MNIEASYNIILSLIGISALILFYVVFWQQYCLDAFRTNLFELRYELIDLVAQKKISHQDTSYIFLRDLINSTIGNGHKFKFTRFMVISAYLSRKAEFKEFSQYHRQIWVESLSSHDPKMRECLQKIRNDYHMAIIQYFLSASILFWFLVILAALFAALTNAVSKFRTLFSVTLDFADSIGISSFNKAVDNRVATEVFT